MDPITKPRTGADPTDQPDEGALAVLAGAEVVDEVEDEQLVEEISIDGMCGVY